MKFIFVVNTIIEVLISRPLCPPPPSPLTHFLPAITLLSVSVSPAYIFFD